MYDDIVFRVLARMAEENGCSVCRCAPLSAYCTFRVGGPADLLICPPDTDTLCRVLCAANGRVPWYILGNGSNVLAPDEGLRAIVFCTKRIKKIHISGEYVAADCGAMLNAVILTALRAGLGGMGSLYGIPGTVGGAVRMNAGAHGVCMADRLTDVRVFDVRRDRVWDMPVSEAALAYRESRFSREADLVILGARFHLPFVDVAEERARIAHVTRLRRESQPLEYPSAGSVFRRPGTTEAWRLIDGCGMRGYAVGGAEVSERHAGFIVNRGDATARDIRALMDMIRQKVKEKDGVTLVPEVEIW